MKKEKEFRWNVIRSEEHCLEINNEKEFKRGTYQLDRRKWEFGFS